jgi:hypothetical protein
MGLKRWLTERIARFLTKPVGRYELYCRNDVAALKRHVRKGDVLLSQGDQRVSAVIRYLTQSCWSHTSLYVGDEVLRRGGELADGVRAEFGDEAAHLLVEALPEGVILRPLTDYERLNIRVCRPHRLRPEDLKVILDGALDFLGWHYDLRNLIDLARYYLPAQLVPGRLRPRGKCFGSSARSKVICTRLIGELFDRVGYPVLPEVMHPEPAELVEIRGGLREWWRRRRRLPGLFRSPHPSRLAPRDFDLSPYFEIVKFNVIADGRFDYQLIQWVRDEEPSLAEIAEAIPEADAGDEEAA